MKITVFGASGKVGKRVVAILRERGHEVRGVVYGQSALSRQPGLEFVRADVHNAKDVEAAVKGADVVVSTLGSWHTPTKDILSSGMTNIIPAMQCSRITRIVSLTGADALAPGDRPNLLHALLRPVLKITAPKILKDGEEHIRLLAESGLEWTVVRSPVMSTHGNPRKYELGNKSVPPWATIHRQSVALAISDLAENKKSFAQAPIIRRTA